ncbi:phthalate 4,5-dioxygenase reductase subunit [Sphingobium wenxiniae]|nr:PDR/VanB family oxidoreductase [Sphingobium wenxiniae]MBB6192572.1 phthalate 4,5-dioxygenase reductase subunit [Sphingobium wenxiniae]
MFGADSAELNLQVGKRRNLTPEVVEFTLVREDGGLLPPFTPGAHIAVQTPSGAVRQYSLVGDGDAPREYRIAIKLEPASRGGSSSMIGNALEGARLTVSEPKNDFEMEADSRYLFIAAGIGVTPIYSMARHADAQGADYRIIYLARSPDTAPYLEEMKEEFGERLQPHFTGGDSAKRYDFWDEFVQPRSERVYCCGPKTLIEEIRDVSGHWPEGKVRFEDFKPVEVVRADDVAFDVHLAKSNVRFTVPADRSIIEAMRENGIATVSSCESGTCGTCKTRLISGAVDHRDLVLRDDEKKDFIMTCVSRAREGELVLDL